MKTLQHRILTDDVSIYICFGNGCVSKEVEQLYSEGFIDEDLYAAAKEEQHKLDNQTF